MRSSDQEMLILLVLIVVGLYAHQKGLLKPYIDKLKELMGGAGAKLGGGGSGQATGDCKGGPYSGTGKVVEADIDKEYGERHYASGKPDTTTIEANAKGIAFQKYQFVVYVTLTSKDQDDTVSLKLGGTHMGSGGWWDHGVGFGGETCLGREPDHPNTNACVVKGQSVGDIMNKKIGVAATCDKSNTHTELWVDTGGGWKKMVEGDNVDGHKPPSGNHEAQLRIDAAKVTIHCATIQEISGTGTATTPATTTPAETKTEESKYARAYNVFHRPTPRLVPDYPLIPRVALANYKDEIDECASRRVLHSHSPLSYEEEWAIEHAYATRPVKDCGNPIPKGYKWY